MNCHLCNKDKDLRKSHILPEFVYKTLYDDKHKFHVLSNSENRLKPKEQKGIRERLLCDACEQKLSINEKYTSEALLGGVPIMVRDVDNLIEISELNYKKFKLFQLSILWRASIASHKIFSDVGLGKHEDILRDMVLNEIPGKQMDYPCLILGLNSEEDMHRNIIDQPRKLKHEGHTIYRFIFCGLLWLFFVSSHSFPRFLKEVVLSESGKILVGKGDFEKIFGIKDYAVELHRLGRLT